MTAYNNSNNMSTQEIKEVLINTFKRSAEKSVQDASYDKTILATIQFCTDATIGQYKIKYQNGYYTAYSRDTLTTYMNNALVYVLVPGNDMNNRLFITGAASNDSSQRTYATYLEGDQAYSVDGSNYISLNGEQDINLSSYWGAPNTYRKTLWSANPSPGAINLLNINSQANEYLKTATAIRVGASFKTTLDDSRKISGDYGVIVTFKYKNASTGDIYYKNFKLDTFHMNGNPFNFNVYMPQYDYWQVDQTDFVGIDKIEEYVVGFPQGEDPGQLFRDIYIKDISLYKAVKLYDTNNDKYRVEVQSDDNFDFFIRTNDDIDVYKPEIVCRATLKVNGNPVQSSSNQNVQYYWAKEDVTVDSINHPKYNKYTGKGWYCLNTGNKITYDAASATKEDLKNYTILQSDTSVGGQAIEWNYNMPDISILRSLCKGKITRIKCVVFYENQIISSEIKEVLNREGYYILLHSKDGKVQSYNGLGGFTLTAGVFQDIGGTAPRSRTLNNNINYHWVEIDEKGIEKPLPSTLIDDILINNLEWDQEQDNETLSDEEIADYLAANPNVVLCRERYNYYHDRYTQLYENPQSDAIQIQRAKERSETIISVKTTNIKHMYTMDNDNSSYYILGPSSVSARYANEELKDYRSAEIINTHPYYYGTQLYTEQVVNTLYNLPAYKIGNKATYKVTAILTENNVSQPIGTAEITLINSSGASLDYSLEITNGTQGFMYNEGGLSPDILIKPLFFKLYDKAGALLFDSEYPENTSSTINITSLNPIWRFYDTPYSLIKTGYKGSTMCSVSATDATVLEVTNASNLVYSLASEYDINKKENSNIELKVTYNDAVVMATTHFTFVKQGDLGTNGTNMLLDIDDNVYNQYKSNILSEKKWSDFSTVEGGRTITKHYQPSQRHLGNTYLFATMAYNANGEPQLSTNTCRYVNLKFAAGAMNIDGSPTGVNGSATTTLYGYWYQDGQMSVIDSSSVWSSEIIKGAYKGVKYYLKPSFNIINTTGQYTQLRIPYMTDNENQVEMTYKPTLITDYTIEGITYDKKIANNIIRVASSKTLGEDTSIQRFNYGYYAIPYFYFNFTGSEPMPAGFDPARHIVITGGFDQIVYDSAGENPSYNKQEPFTFFIFDEEGRNITQEVVDGIATGKTNIYWSHSDGLQPINSISSTEEIQTYASFSDNENLYKKYCRYNNKVYVCNTSYTKGQLIEIKDADDQIINTYQPGSFVTPYWEEVVQLNESIQKFSVRPYNKYDMVAQKDLFNSWISVNITYVKSENQVYNAEALIPINILCNKYGSTEINNWDGKKTIIDDAYMISSKIAAGVKNNDNTFTGITLGTNFYPDNDERKNEIGLFGYGTPNTNDPESWARTMFIDAQTGRAIFGPTGSTQIVLDPRVPTTSRRVWSRLAGWYFDRDLLYKPIGEGNNLTFNELSQGDDVDPPNTGQGSAGMYIPWEDEVTDDTRFLWASNTNINYSNFMSRTPNFYLTYGGHVHCSDLDAVGSIVATSGSFGTSVNRVDINIWKGSEHYILWNKNFWIKDTGGTGTDDVAACVKGKIMAKSGQIGNVSDDADGNSAGTLFIEYNWYPWHLPADNEPWNSTYMYLDTSQGMSQKYALYNKNFYVTNTGEAFFNGKLFTETGRIGNWVINRNYLGSVNGNVRLAPDRLTIGAFSADENGNLQGQQWYIRSDGTASFQNNGNTFVGRSFSTPSGSTFGDDGLRLAVGEKFYIGDTYLTAGPNGFVFYGGIVVWEDSRFHKTVTFDKNIFLGGSTGGIDISKEKISFSGTGGTYNIYQSGNADLNAVTVKSLSINGTSLDDYITEKVRQYTTGRYVTGVTGRSESGSNPITHLNVIKEQ